MPAKTYHQVRLPAESYKRLKRLRAKLADKNGKIPTINELIILLIDSYEASKDIKK